MIRIAVQIKPAPAPSGSIDKQSKHGILEKKKRAIPISKQLRNVAVNELRLD